MTEFENVRQVLQELVDFNNTRTELPITKELGNNGKVIVEEHEVTARDLQEINYEDLCILCDLLGMSDIYLGGKQ